MADCDVNKKHNEDVDESSTCKRSHTVEITDKGQRESLEDLLTTLGQQINNSDWLQLNTADKFAVENPEVAKAFRDAASTKSHMKNGDVGGDSAES